MSSPISWAQNHPKAAALYGGFAAGCYFIYTTLQTKSTGTYDYLLTLSAGLQTLAFALLVFDTRSSVGEGLSEKALWAFLIAHVARISTTVWGQGYVPEDNTADVYLYQSLEVVAALMMTYKLLQLSALRTMHDVGQGMERWSAVIGMVGVAGALSFITQSTGHNDYFADLSWMFSVWLDCFALFPQVWLLSVQSQVDESMAHFAVGSLASSLVFGLFWGKVAQDRYAEFEADGQHIFFKGILAAVAIRCFLNGAYVYLFFKSANKTGAKGDYELCSNDEL
jgi:hypothetical protein